MLRPGGLSYCKDTFELFTCGSFFLRCFCLITALRAVLTESGLKPQELLAVVGAIPICSNRHNLGEASGLGLKLLYGVQSCEPQHVVTTKWEYTEEDLIYSLALSQTLFWYPPHAKRQGAT